MDVQLIEIFIIIVIRAESSSRKSDVSRSVTARLSSFMCDDAAVYGRVQAPELWGPQTQYRLSWLRPVQATWRSYEKLRSKVPILMMHGEVGKFFLNATGRWPLVIV